MPNRRRIASCGKCDEPRSIVARGLCSRCYQQAAHHGTLEQYVRQRLTVAESFVLARASETDEGCWPWPRVAANGYGTVVQLDDGSTVGAHVAAWVAKHGPIPSSKIRVAIDHLCHTRDRACPGSLACGHRRCVNPDHLELVTYQEQSRRKHGYTARTCLAGHPRNERNVYWVNDKGYRYRGCRSCDLETVVTRMSADQLREIEHLLKVGISQQRIGECVGVRQQDVSKIKQVLRLRESP